MFILSAEAIPSHGSCGAFDEELIEVECPAGAIFPETTQNLNALDRPGIRDPNGSGSVWNWIILTFCEVREKPWWKDSGFLFFEFGNLFTNSSRKLAGSRCFDRWKPSENDMTPTCLIGLYLEFSLASFLACLYWKTIGTLTHMPANHCIWGTSCTSVALRTWWWLGGSCATQHPLLHMIRTIPLLSMPPGTTVRFRNSKMLQQRYQNYQSISQSIYRSKEILKISNRIRHYLRCHKSLGCRFVVLERLSPGLTTVLVNVWTFSKVACRAGSTNVLQELLKPQTQYLLGCFVQVDWNLMWSTNFTLHVDLHHSKT